MPRDTQSSRLIRGLIGAAKTAAGAALPMIR
jgi:hypothetical protein